MSLKKTLLLIATLFIVNLTFAQTSKSKKSCKRKCKHKKEQCSETATTPVTYMDSVSYALGMFTSKNFTDFKDSINVDQLFKGFQHENDSIAIFTEADLEVILQDFSIKLQEAAQQKILKEHDDFLAEVATYDNMGRTPSGLLYRAVNQVAGERPTANDTVVVNYVGKLKDGTVFDQGQEVKFGLNQVIPGWTEGLQFMSVGSKYEFYLPHTIAYGPRGSMNPMTREYTIPPYAALYFEVELLEVIKGEL